jgi:hypothetical protein
MVWQDIVITSALILFSVSLLPQVYYGFKKKKGYITLKTSVPTFIGLVTIMVAYLSLDLLLSTVMTGAAALMWLVLVVQRLIYKKV